MEHESIRRLKILQILLLIIRTLMVLFIVLMITRPVLSGMFTWFDDPESTLSVIVMDDTFSTKGNSEMMSRETVMESALDHTLEMIEKNSTIIVASLCKGIIYRGLKKDLPENVFEAFSFFSGGDYYTVMEDILDLKKSEFLNHELFIFSDAQKSNFIQGDLDWNRFRGWNTYFFKLGRLENNLAVLDVKVLNEIPISNAPVDIEVTVVNTGNQTAENRLLQLSFDDINVGQQVISLGAGASSKFTFQTAFHRSGLKAGIVELGADDRMEDNRFYFHVTLPEKISIQLISPRFEETLFIRNAVLALNQSEDLFQIAYGNEQDLRYQLDIRNTDVLILQGVSKLSDDIQQKIVEFVRSGHHLILLPGLDMKQMPYLQDMFGISLNETATVLAGEAYQILKFNAAGVQAFQQTINSADKGMIKAFKFISLPTDDHSLMFVDDHQSVWNRYQMRNGLVDVFGVSMELGWTNFPITGSFIPFWHKLLYSASVGKMSNPIDSDGEWEISQVFSRDSQSLQHVFPDGTSEIVQPADDSSLIIGTLRMPGFHRIYNAGTVLAELAVRIPESELTSPEFDDSQLKEKFTENLLIIYDADELSYEIKLAHTGIELWKWFLGLFILFMILEMFLSNVYGAKKQ